MKGKVGDRVQNTKKSRNGRGKVIKKIGVIEGPGDESFWNPKNETPTDRYVRLQKFAETHTRIKWQGTENAYNHPDSGFEII